VLLYRVSFTSLFAGTGARAHSGTAAPVREVASQERSLSVLPMRWVAALATATIALVFTCPCLHAQEILLPEFSLEVEEELFFSGAGAVTVITPSEERPEKSLGDMLMRAPGVHVRSQGTGNRQTITIRAADGRQIAILVDGVPLGNSAGGTLDASQIPVEAVERIEVYRGGRGALAGDGALGGVVVIRLKKGWSSSAKASVHYGSFNSIGGAVAGQHLGWSASYSYAHTDGDFAYKDTNGANRVRENNQSDSHKASLGRKQKLWRDATLSLQGLASWSGRGSPGLEQFPSKKGHEELGTYLASAALEQNLPGWQHLEKLTASLSWSLSDWAFQEPDPYLPPPSDSSSRAQRLDSAVAAHLALGSAFSMELGAGARHEWAVVARLPGPKEAHWERTGGHTVVNLLWAPLRGLEARGAARVAFHEGFDPIVMPAIELSYAFPIDLGITLSATRAWRLPQFEELYFEAAGVRGNPDLRPEEAWGSDVSLWFKREWVRAEATFFYQSITDNILFLPKSPFLIQATNAQGVSSYGAEASFGLQTTHFSLDASVTWLEASLEPDEVRLPLKPRWLFHVSPSANWGPASLAVALRGQSQFFLDRFEARSEESRLLLDAKLLLEVGYGFRVAVQGNNLTNKLDALDAFQQPLAGASYLISVEKIWSDEDEN